MIGDAGVGKTTLLYKYLHGSVPHDTDMTIGVDFGSKMVDIEDAKVKLHIWDTSGQEKFRSITRSYYRCAAGGIVLYDITNRKSFENVRRWIEDVRIFGNNFNMAIMLLGNKSDIEHHREVSYEEGEALARSEGLFFAETSAIKNPSDAFVKIASKIYEKRSELNVGIKRVPLMLPNPRRKPNICC
jgi:small GTP-binding protein